MSVQRFSGPVPRIRCAPLEARQGIITKFSFFIKVPRDLSFSGDRSRGGGHPRVRPLWLVKNKDHFSKMTFPASSGWWPLQNWHFSKVDVSGPTPHRWPQSIWINNPHSSRQRTYGRQCRRGMSCFLRVELWKDASIQTKKSFVALCVVEWCFF